MLLTIGVTVTVLAILFAFSRRSDRRLRSGAMDLAPYRFGFLLGLVLYLLSLLALYRIVVELAAGRMPVAVAVWVVLVLLAARGVRRRRRSGWILAALLPLWFALPAAVVVFGGGPEPLVIVAAALLATATMAVYARRRWHELDGRGNRGPAAGESEPLVPIPDAATETSAASAN